MTDRELDALVAEKVMGWHSESALGFGDQPIQRWFDGAGIRVAENFRPSADIAAAWRVVERLSLSVVRHNGRFAVGRTQPGTHQDNPEIRTLAIDTSAPRAICLAALKAVGHTVEDQPRP